MGRENLQLFKSGTEANTGLLWYTKIIGGKMVLS